MSGRRRPKGSGGVMERKDGRWMAQLWVDGKRRTRYAKSERAALLKLEELRREAERGVPDAATLTLEDYLTTWLAEVQCKARSPRTYESFELQCRLHIIPVVGKVKLRDLRPSHVERVVATAMAAGHRRTAIYARNVLRIALNRAMRERLVPDNAAALADVPANEPRPSRTLTLAEVQRVMHAPHSQHALWVLAFATGMRMSELLGLQWEDVDLAAGSVRVRRQLAVIGGARVLSPLKTRHATGDLQLAPQAVAALENHRARTGRTRGYVFLSAAGTPIRREGLHRMWTRLLKRLGVEHVAFHAATRATCATLLYAEGVPDKVIQSVLRHARVSTTMDIYIRAVPGAQQSAVDAMTRILSDSQPDSQ